MNAAGSLSRIRGIDLPVLTHEMRIRQRGVRPFLVMFGYVAILVVMTLGMLDWLANAMPRAYSGPAQNYYSNDLMSQWGRRLFTALSFSQLVMISLVVPAYSAGVISSEKEKGTMDMLSVTMLTSSEIVGQKLLAAVAQAVMLVVASIPVMGTVFLLGGVSPFEVAVAYALIVLTTVFLGGVGLIFSCLLKSTSSATFATYLTAFLFFAGLPIAGQLLPALADHGVGNANASALFFTIAIAFCGGLFALVLYGPVAYLLSRRTERWRVRVFRMGTFGAVYAVALLALSQRSLVDIWIGSVYMSGVFLPVYLNPFFAMIALINGEDLYVHGIGYTSGLHVMAIALPPIFCAACAYYLKRISTFRFEAMRRT